MYATARLIVRDEALAEDATQEALVNAWRYLPSLRDPDRFEAWLYRLLVNACRTQFRSSRRHKVVEIDVALAHVGDGDPGIPIADRDQLERGFRRLDADERAVVILRFYRGYTVPRWRRSSGSRSARRSPGSIGRRTRCGRARGGCPLGTTGRSRA
jgi:RNA polymerase sigma-70 factor (ECF subfamily)